jgi:outer membrane protein assembly factor BamB
MFRLFAPSWLILAVLALPAQGVDWTQFRGPNGLGVSDETKLPAEWSADENVVWRTKLPGLGTSSPITLGQSIYLTCYSGYAESIEEPGDMANLQRHLVCLERMSGKLVWTKAIRPQLPESAYQGGNDSRHGYSSSTPTTDGKHLYVFFGKSGVFCFDLEGNEIWNTVVGTGSRGWGSSNSPVLFNNVLIVNASVESRSLVGLDKLTGKEIWRADGIRSSWNTPALVKTAEGKTEVVVSVQRSLLGFDPETGESLWRCDGIPTYACPSAISNDGIVYVTGGRGTQYTLAVRTGGNGDVTDSHVLWKVPTGSNVSSPVYHDGHLYIASDGRGIAYCFNAKSGEVVYEERLSPRPGRIYSSPILADGKVYYMSQHAGAYVVAAKPEFELVAHNVFEGDDSRANACPVVSNGNLLLRNDTYLYCIGE